MSPELEAILNEFHDHKDLAEGLLKERRRVAAAAARLERYLDGWYPHRSTSVVALYETLAILKDA